MNKNPNSLAVSVILLILGNESRGRSKIGKIFVFTVKFRRCGKHDHNLQFYSNAIKLTDNYISALFFLSRAKYLKSDLQKENYDFFKIPHKEPFQNLGEHAVC